MPRLARGRDVITQPLYDTVQFGAAALTSGSFIKLFTVPQGQGTTAIGTAGSKVEADTNMTLGGQLPAPWGYRIMAIACQLDPQSTFADINAAIASLSFRLTIGAKDWLTCPLSMLPAGGGADGVSSLVAASQSATTTTLRTGIADARAIYALSRPLIINEQENFSCQITAGRGFTFSAAAQSWVRVILHGELSRSIQ